MGRILTVQDPSAGRTMLFKDGVPLGVVLEVDLDTLQYKRLRLTEEQCRGDWKDIDDEDIEKEEGTADFMICVREGLEMTDALSALKKELHDFG
jgi:hypothetical protein